MKKISALTRGVALAIALKLLSVDFAEASALQSEVTLSPWRADLPIEAQYAESFQLVTNALKVPSPNPLRVIYTISRDEPEALLQMRILLLGYGLSLQRAQIEPVTSEPSPSEKLILEPIFSAHLPGVDVRIAELWLSTQSPEFLEIVEGLTIRLGNREILEALAARKAHFTPEQKLRVSRYLAQSAYVPTAELFGDVALLLIEDDRSEVRRNAVRSLASLSSSAGEDANYVAKALPALLRVLREDPVSQVREEAARALQNSAPTPVIADGLLTALFECRENAVTKAVLDTLNSITRRARYAFDGYIVADNVQSFVNAREFCSRLATRKGPDGNPQNLIQFYETTSATLQAMAYPSIVHCPSPEALLFLQRDWDKAKALNLPQDILEQKESDYRTAIGYIRDLAESTWVHSFQKREAFEFLRSFAKLPLPAKLEEELIREYQSLRSKETFDQFPQGIPKDADGDEISVNYVDNSGELVLLLQILRGAQLPSTQDFLWSLWIDSRRAIRKEAALDLGMMGNHDSKLAKKLKDLIEDPSSPTEFRHSSALAYTLIQGAPFPNPKAIQGLTDSLDLESPDRAEILSALTSLLQDTKARARFYADHADVRRISAERGEPTALGAQFALDLMASVKRGDESLFSAKPDRLELRDYADEWSDIQHFLDKEPGRISSAVREEALIEILANEGPIFDACCATTQNKKIQSRRIAAIAASLCGLEVSPHVAAQDNVVSALAFLFGEPKKGLAERKGKELEVLKFSGAGGDYFIAHAFKLDTDPLPQEYIDWLLREFLSLSHSSQIATLDFLEHRPGAAQLDFAEALSNVEQDLREELDQLSRKELPLVAPFVAYVEFAVRWQRWMEEKERPALLSKIMTYAELAVFSQNDAEEGMRPAFVLIKEGWLDREAFHSTVEALLSSYEAELSTLAKNQTPQAQAEAQAVKRFLRLLSDVRDKT